MKRTNLVVDAQLLEETLRLSGERTYSRAVEVALDAYVKRARAGQMLELAGKGLWDGRLAEMRGDVSKERRPPVAGRHVRVG